MKTVFTTSETVQKAWYLVDVDGLVLGRIASKIATVLRGKNKPEFNPSQDVGDFVVVVNVEKLKFTGKKLTDKIYYKSTGTAGGMKQTILKDMLIRHPERVLEEAVKGMLPGGPLGRKMLSKLKIFKGDKHDHQAQNVVPVTL